MLGILFLACRGPILDHDQVEPKTLESPDPEVSEIDTPQIVALLKTADIVHISTRHDQTILIRLQDGRFFHGRYQQVDAGKYSEEEHLFDIYNLVIHITNARDDLENFTSLSTE